MTPLEFAMQVELDGKEFYLKQAELMEDSGLKKVFVGLAEDEEKHYQLLKQMQESGKYDYQESTMIDRAESIFAEPLQGKIPEEKQMSYVAVYQQALEFEEKAIDLYGQMARDAKSEEERETFLTLEREEEGHRRIIARILQFLQSPEELYPYI